MSVFNTPVLRTINETPRTFPRLLMPDIELLGKKLVEDRKRRTRATYQASGYTKDDLPGLLLRLELEDYDEYQAVAIWSQKIAGAKAVITTSWVKAGGKESDVFGPDGFLTNEFPGDLRNLAWEILNPPAPVKKEEPKNPPEGQTAPENEEA